LGLGLRGRLRCWFVRFSLQRHRAPHSAAYCFAQISP
jgi:hypothetical protein